MREILFPDKYNITLFNIYTQQHYNKNLLLTPWLYIPGAPHFLHKKYQLKGLLFFLGFALSVLTIITVLVLPVIFKYFNVLCAGNCQQFLNTYFKIKDTVFLAQIGQLPVWIILFIVFLSVMSILYFSYKSYEDYINSFYNVEFDQKTKLFPSMFSLSYFTLNNSLILFLLYSLFTFTPPVREIPLEIVFIDNPELKTKVPDQKTKRIAKENAKNSGKSVKNKPIAPGKYQEKKRITPMRQKNTGKVNSSSARRAAPKNKQAAKHTTKASKPTPQVKPKPRVKPQKSVKKPEKIEKVQKKIPAYKQAKTATPQKKPQPVVEPTPQVKPNPFSKQQQKAPQGDKGIKSPIRNKNQAIQSQRAPSRSGNSQPNRNRGPGTIKAKKNVDYGPYMRDLQRLITSTWQPVRSSSKDSVIVLFNILNTGRLVPGSIKIKYASNPGAEKAAIDAIMRAAVRFRPLPLGSAKEVTVEFKFSKMGVSSAN